MRLFLIVPAEVKEVLGSLSDRIDSDPILGKKVKGTGLELRKLAETAASACARSPRVRSNVDKVGAWLACMDEVLGKAVELLSKGAPLSDHQFDAEVDGSGVTVRDAVKPFYEACKRNTARVLQDPEEDARLCTIHALTATRLRLKELLS
ncbi:MAG: hypothetical protein ABWK00_05870 [Desulfurococcaceae archaeon]